MIYNFLNVCTDPFYKKTFKKFQNVLCKFKSTIVDNGHKSNMIRLFLT